MTSPGKLSLEPISHYDRDLIFRGVLDWDKTRTVKISLKAKKYRRKPAYFMHERCWNLMTGILDEDRILDNLELFVKAIKKSQDIEENGPKYGLQTDASNSYMACRLCFLTLDSVAEDLPAEIPVISP